MHPTLSLRSTPTALPVGVVESGSVLAPPPAPAPSRPVAPPPAPAPLPASLASREAWHVAALDPPRAPAARVHPDSQLLRRAFAPAEPSEATLERLRTSALVLRHGIGALSLASPVQPVPAWWLLRRGRIALGWQTDAGEFVEKRSIGPGDWLDVAGALATPPAWVDAAQCRTPVELLALPLCTLFDACAMDPALMRAVGQQLASRVRSLSDTLHDVVTADVPARLARWLLRCLEAQPERTAAAIGSGVQRLRLTEQKQAIAAQIGTTSETLSRALRRLADSGILQVSGYDLTLLDLPALRAIARPCHRGASARQSFAGRRGTA
jgi:CRP-like cAMP-binding protein